MENMGAVTELMLFSLWGNYVIWILLYAAMITACAIGLKSNKNTAFVLLLISVCLNLLHHLPSIFVTLGMFSSPGNLMGAKAQEYISGYYAAGGAVSLLAAILMVIGLFMLVKKGPETGR